MDISFTYGFVKDYNGEIMQDLNMHQLRIFCAVARLGSFTRAGEELYISQPAVSAQVLALEQAVGTPLLHRLGRQIVLTEVGKVAYEYATRIFSLTKELGQAVDDLKGLQAGTLLIGASATPGGYLLPQVMGAFKERYPHVRLELSISNPAGIVQQVLRHELDLGFVGDPVSDLSLEASPYKPDELVIFASPQHRFASTHRIPMAELEKEQFVMRAGGQATRKWAEQSLREAGVQVQVAMELGNNEAVKRAVAAGLGIGMVSRYALDFELQAVALVIADVVGLECRRMLYIIRHKDKRLTMAHRAFLELL